MAGRVKGWINQTRVVLVSVRSMCVCVCVCVCGGGGGGGLKYELKTNQPNFHPIVTMGIQKQFTRCLKEMVGKCMSETDKCLLPSQGLSSAHFIFSSSSEYGTVFKM